MGKNKRTAEYVFKPMKLYLVCIVLAFCIGIGVVVGISIYGGLTLAKRARYDVATGTVVDYEKTEGSIRDSSGIRHSVDLYAEIAVFEVDGVRYTVTNGVSSTSGLKNIGDPIEIAYDPADPTDCMFVTAGNTVGYVVVAAVGVIFICAGVGLLVYYRKAYRKWQNQISSKTDRT